MRRTVTGIALVAAAAALLTGCGSGSGGGDGKQAGQDASKAPSQAASTPAGKPAGEEATREVTFEVLGHGSTQVFWTAGDSSTEQVKLPWSKTIQLSLKGAELKVGSLVSIVPGSVAGSDGQLRPAPCVIKVDGKQVADNEQGKSIAGCKYLVK
ncbi:hypothetical protein [Streptomyces sp. NPDC046821]|uniref:hypothetical protein n=1 Tax=Streptomyces sp. NPDC046821 TaxID=3154702 RepID=UPI00340E7B5E